TGASETMRSMVLRWRWKIGRCARSKMRKLMNLGMIAAAAFLLTIGFATLGRRGHQTSREGPVNPVGPAKSIFPVSFLDSAPQPSERDVADCNDYATWVVAREAHIDGRAAQGEVIAIGER